MEVFDIKRVHKSLYSGKEGAFALIDVPPIQYLAVDGEGDPNTHPDYASAVQALFSLAYTIKFASKAAGRDLRVAPLEGLWTSSDYGAFLRGEKEAWRWTMLIAQPDWIAADLVAAGTAEAIRKGARRVEDVALRTLSEGRCVQTLHVGPYDAEAATLARLHTEYLPQNGLVPSGDHHEIYLSDPRRTAPGKLKTLLRQPVAPRAGGA